MRRAPDICVSGKCAERATQLQSCPASGNSLPPPSAPARHCTRRQPSPSPHSAAAKDSLCDAALHFIESALHAAAAALPLQPQRRRRLTARLAAAAGYLFERRWGGCSGSELVMPQGIAVDGKGNVFVADAGQVRRGGRHL